MVVIPAADHPGELAAARHGQRAEQTHLERLRAGELTLYGYGSRAMLLPHEH
jgi:hypothetical protein